MIEPFADIRFDLATAPLNNMADVLSDSSHRVEEHFVNAPPGMRTGMTKSEGPSRTQYALSDFKIRGANMPAKQETAAVSQPIEDIVTPEMIEVAVEVLLEDTLLDLGPSTAYNLAAEMLRRALISCRDKNRAVETPARL